ncbi:MAG: hypothetical protein EOL97_13440 [Spirochaetia bacterium]|nr:hypothetical protein [Spirochaetia bacterium]
MIIMTYTKKTTEEVKDNIEINVVLNTTQINDINPGSVLDVFASSIAEEIGEQYDDLEEINNGSKIDTATGENLEQLGKLLGVERTPGVNATGEVTFIRNTLPTSTFIIPAGTIVGTAPNSTVQQYSFITQTALTFPLSVVDEEYTYDNTITNYTLNSKVVSSITSVSGISGGSATTFTQNVDYKLTKNSDDGDEIEWLGATSPDNATIFKVTYKPLGMTTNIIASNIGTDYNMSKGQITYKISSISQIDRIYNFEPLINGLDIENDISLKDRIQNASSLQSRATADAIKYNILDKFSYVNSVTVFDLPLKVASQEQFVFNSGTTNYALSQKIAQNTETLVISNTSGGTADYVRDTDYTLNINNEIVWDTGETNPSDTDTFYVVAYDYKKLGHAEVLVIGKTGELSPTELSDIQDYLDGEDIRAAGTVITVYQPTYIDIDIEVNIEKTSGFTDGEVTTAIEASLNTYFNTLTAGEDILLAKIIGSCINTTGVDNVTVVDIGGGGATDYTIDDDEVGVIDTITINYI